MISALVLWVAAAVVPPAAEPPEPPPAASTYLFEWVSRTGAATRRLTLFSDGVLVRKSVSEDGKTELKKRKLSEDEYDFYAKYFGSPESAEAAGHFETGLGDPSAKSEVAFAPAGAEKWTLSFDSFSVLSAPAARVKSALEGLLDSFGKVLPNENEFALERLQPGTVLRRRDGQEFRIVHVDESTRVVEARAIGQPYSQFFQWSKLRYSFFPP